YELSLSSDRSSYICGMQADFVIRLTDNRNRPVNLQNRYLHATFPDAQTPVDLVQVNATTWHCSAETSKIGANTLRVELRQDHRQEVARLQQAIASCEAAIAELQAEIARWQRLLEQTDRLPLRRFYAAMIRFCETLIQVNARLISISQSVISQLERPLAQAEKTVEVFARPAPCITAPAANSFLRGEIEIKANLSWSRGATVVLFVDNREESRQETAASSAVFALDTRKFADRKHILSVRLDPTGFPTSYASPEIEVLFDNTPPTANHLCPSDRAVLNNPAPLIQAVLSDNLSGIDLTSIALLVRGESVPVELQPNGLGLIARYQPLALAEGDTPVVLTFSDLAGNVCAREWSFAIDFTPPEAPRLYEATSPILVEENQALVRLATSKDVVAVEARKAEESALVVQTGATADNLLWTVSLTDLAQGENRVTAVARDAAGNYSHPLVFIVQVGIPDHEPPIILSFSPASGTSFDSDKIDLAGTALNHAYARTMAKVWRQSGNGEVLVWEGESEQIEKIAGPDDQGRFTWSWAMPGVILGRGLN
ncbi:MAG: hypothetical protein N3A66_08420, partial [Planctomycetota bacterium]|nr:hypothetical protein [Planctomycetota bacterium]